MIHWSTLLATFQNEPFVLCHFLLCDFPSKGICAPSCGERPIVMLYIILSKISLCSACVEVVLCWGWACVEPVLGVAAVTAAVQAERHHQTMNTRLGAPGQLKIVTCSFRLLQPITTVQPISDCHWLLQPVTASNDCWHFAPWASLGHRTGDMFPTLSRVYYCGIPNNFYPSCCIAPTVMLATLMLCTAVLLPIILNNNS